MTTQAIQRDFEIRFATPEEAGAISELLAEAFAPVEPHYTREAFEHTTPPTDVIRARFEEGPLWVATKDSEIIGTVSGLAEPDRFYIRSMAVKPAVQGSGIGSLLLKTAEEFAKRHGFSLAYLYTTYHLRSAIRLYERNGYKTIRESPPEEFFGTAGIEMEKILI